MAAARQTRAEKKAETKERLLAAAERIARRDGFARISLDRVAEAAGLTKGAVYSNFASKEEFLLEVVVRSTNRLHVGDDIFEAADAASLLEKIATSLAHAASTRRKDVVVAFEFVTSALRDSKLRQAYMGEPQEEAFEDAAGRWIEEHGDELPVPAEPFFEVVNALAWGFLLRRLLHGEDAVTDDVMRWGFTRLLPWGPDSSG